MKRPVVCLVVFAPMLAAQTAETAYFRGIMLPSNEVPAVSFNGSAAATLIAHVVRDNTGQILSGSVDFMVKASLPAAVTVTGLHIHNGPAGQNAGVVINTGISAVNSVPLDAGSQTVSRQAQVIATDTNGLDALRGMFRDPSGYYVNIHTTDFPGGVMRGQLQRAEARVFMGFMDAANEVPAPSVNARGMAQVVAVATRDASGRLTSGELSLSAAYTFTQAYTITGFHIHPGAAGTNGPAVLGAPVPAGTTTDAGGNGVLGPYSLEVAMDNAQMVNTFDTLLRDAGATYINVHTSTNPAGIMRAQLRATDEMTFQAMLSSANESPAPSVTATAPSAATVYTLRNEDGSIAAATVRFDVNYRFPGAASFTGLHIHNGAAGTNGPVRVPMIPSYAPAFTSSTGFGNFFGYTPALGPGDALNTLIAMTTQPENAYMNLHTSVDAGGAVRAQVGAALSAAPVIQAVLPANLDKNATAVAPGGLISIFGTNLAHVATDLSGWSGSTVPDSLNGVAIAVGGARGRLLYVTPTQINAEVPVEAAAGSRAVLVYNGTNLSAEFPVTVNVSAPAIFFSPAPAIVKNSDFSLVSASNPARANDVIVVYLTGLGATTPALSTGRLAAASPVANTAPVTATIGGQDAAVVYSIASPGLTGVYQVALRVPAGLPAGNAALVVKQGNAASNSVNVAVQ